MSHYPRRPTSLLAAGQPLSAPSCWKGRGFILTGIDAYAMYELPFWASKPQPSRNPGAYEMPDPLPWNPTQHHPTQGPTAH